jgi:hypothetical protein
MELAAKFPYKEQLAYASLANQMGLALIFYLYCK